MTARNSADDYTGAIRALLPRGRVWPVDADSEQARVVACYAQAIERLDSDAVSLLSNAFPASTSSLIDEWEETLGLPDPCLGPNPTLQQRRDQVVARLANTGGQSKAYFIAFAARLGFEISITEYSPFRVGRNTVGQPLMGDAWSFAWLITILSGATSADHALFRVGENRAGDPLASSSSAATALECELRAAAPAHTILLFGF